MIDQADSKDSIIVTCDSVFIGAWYSEQAYKVGRGDQYAQLEEVLEFFEFSSALGGMTYCPAVQNAVASSFPGEEID